MTKTGQVENEVANAARLDRLEEHCRFVSLSRNGAPREQSAPADAPQTVPLRR